MSATKTIVIIDDDGLLRQTLIEQFSRHGEFAIREAVSAQDGLAALQAAPADLVLLDASPPDMDGRAALQAIRDHGYHGPVIILAARDSEADAMLGLDPGPNDCVTKPFRFSVLLARMRAHLRQNEDSEEAAVRVGPYAFKPSAKLLLRGDGGKIRLTEKEAAIIGFLLQAGGRIVSREVLLQDVFGYTAGVATHTLETHVYRLRQKIEQDPSRAEILVTEAGGYRLIP